jgi:hypothetical protein
LSGCGDTGEGEYSDGRVEEVAAFVGDADTDPGLSQFTVLRIVTVTGSCWGRALAAALGRAAAARRAETATGTSTVSGLPLIFRAELRLRSKATSCWCTALKAVRHRVRKAWPFSLDPPPG